MARRARVGAIAWVAVATACGALDGGAGGGSGGSGSSTSGAPGSTSDVPAGDSTAGAADSTTMRGSSGVETSTGAPGPATTTTGSAEDSSTGDPIDPAWQAFLDAREDWLHALAVPILACSAQMDTGHPAFHGCIDWHSHVHATYALHVVYRVTGDTTVLDAAEATLAPAAVAGELADLQMSGIPYEIPYGYAWFLALAVEREQATGATDLVPLAEVIADQLGSWIASRTPQQVAEGILADDYANLSWAALNLWRWAVHAGDATSAAAMEAFVADTLLDPAWDAACPLSAEAVDLDDFFPPCLHRAMAIATIAEPAVATAWLDAWLPDTLDLAPLTVDDVDNAHQAGLNFSRAWGLHALWLATGDAQWRDRYADHVQTHVEQPSLWAENYGAYAHWVAQFGVYAIARTYE